MIEKPAESVLPGSQMAPGGENEAANKTSANADSRSQDMSIKGALKMAACCGAPILLLVALPFLSGTLGAGGTTLLSTAAILICPLGMGFMMWQMRRNSANPHPVSTQTSEDPGLPVPIKEVEDRP